MLFGMGDFASRNAARGRDRDAVKTRRAPILPEKAKFPIRRIISLKLKRNFVAGSRRFRKENGHWLHDELKFGFELEPCLTRTLRWG